MWLPQRPQKKMATSWPDWTTRRLKALEKKSAQFEMITVTSRWTMKTMSCSLVSLFHTVTVPLDRRLGEWHPQMIGLAQWIIMHCLKKETLLNSLCYAEYFNVLHFSCLTRDRRFEPHRRHCVVSLSKNINPSLVLVQPRKTRPFITERLLMGRKESNQTIKQKTTLLPIFLKSC